METHLVGHLIFEPPRRLDETSVATISRIGRRPGPDAGIL
jgi:hypothetical protein